MAGCTAGDGVGAGASGGRHSVALSRVSLSQEGGRWGRGGHWGSGSQQGSSVCQATSGGIFGLLLGRVGAGGAARISWLEAALLWAFSPLKGIGRVNG